MSPYITEPVFEIGETLGVDIAGDEEENVETVGELYSCILSKLSERERIDPGACLSSVVFYRLRRGVGELFAVPREAVTPRTEIATIIPAKDRRSYWQALEKTLQLRLPHLTRPRWITVCIWAMTIGLLGAGVMAPSIYPLPRGAPWLGPMITIVGLFCWALHKATRPLATHIPGHCNTVKRTVRTLLAENRRKLVALQQEWSRRAVWELLQAIVVDIWGVEPEKVTPEARFGKELPA